MADQVKIVNMNKISGYNIYENLWYYCKKMELDVWKMNTFLGIFVSWDPPRMIGSFGIKTVICTKEIKITYESCPNWGFLTKFDRVWKLKHVGLSPSFTLIETNSIFERVSHFTSNWGLKWGFLGTRKCMVCYARYSRKILILISDKRAFISIHPIQLSNVHVW